MLGGGHDELWISLVRLDPVRRTTALVGRVAACGRRARVPLCRVHCLNNRSRTMRSQKRAENKSRWRSRARRSVDWLSCHSAPSQSGEVSADVGSEVNEGECVCLSCATLPRFGRVRTQRRWRRRSRMRHACNVLLSRDRLQDLDCLAAVRCERPSEYGRIFRRRAVDLECVSSTENSAHRQRHAGACIIEEQSKTPLRYGWVDATASRRQRVAVG